MLMFLLPIVKFCRFKFNHLENHLAKPYLETVTELIYDTTAVRENDKGYILQSQSNFCCNPTFG